jgi:HlyD family secretion protein
MSARRLATRILAASITALALAACASEPDNRYQGWIEADILFVGPDEQGRIETLSVREGDNVALAAPLFTLDADLQNADLAMAEARLTNARQAFERAKQLLRTTAGTQKALEDAEAALREAEARYNTAQTRLARRRVASPAAGTVQQVYFRPGEMVQASRAVLALLPPGNMKVRFFVPQAVLPTLAIGDQIRVHCDGCPDNIGARIDFIARSAEFTPPVIYSNEERQKLVFLVEARPERPDALRVGQPVSVTLVEKQQ